ncbi:MAG: lipocalin-like domain-containing protein [Muribaculaceae bacterium]|nr:lipocalin-like domain-containing protein [Muribaculaceae bacterium]MDE6558527.1 lipocalin-like domain-containing protein [Muribaculaceae bacterium]
MNQNPISKKTASLIYFIILIIATSLVFIFASCSKGNDMGEIRGQWQLLTIQYPDGTTVQPDGTRRYISFDLHVIQLTATDDSDSNFYRCVGNVTGDVPDMTFNFPYVNTENDYRNLANWGISANPVSVTVTTLNGNHLVMKVGDNILTLRRF